MTSHGELGKLLLICQARYDHQRQAFSKVLVEETRLRNELLRISAMGQTQSSDHNQLTGMQFIGADLLWNGWLGRSKAELNMKLARILAIKEFEQNKVRQSFGKVVALRDMIEKEQSESRKKANQAALLSAIDFSLI